MMKNVKMHILLFGSLFLLLQSVSFSQRCGDAINFCFNSSSEMKIDSSSIIVTGFFYDENLYTHADLSGRKTLSIKYNLENRNTPETVYVSKVENHVEWKDKDHFQLRTYCGLRLMEINVSYLNSDETMRLFIYNIPGDLPLKLKTTFFTAGSYEINLNRTLDTVRFKEDPDGVVTMNFSSFSKVD